MKLWMVHGYLTDDNGNLGEVRTSWLVVAKDATEACKKVDVVCSRIHSVMFYGTVDFE